MYLWVLRQICGVIIVEMFGVVVLGQVQGIGEGVFYWFILGYVEEQFGYVLGYVDGKNCCQYLVVEVGW